MKDTTELRGEKFPWVLKDDLDLLESERVWWLEVRWSPPSPVLRIPSLPRPRRRVSSRLYAPR